jgi:hypothetical protein
MYKYRDLDESQLKLASRELKLASRELNLFAAPAGAAAPAPQ